MNHEYNVSDQWLAVDAVLPTRLNVVVSLEEDYSNPASDCMKVIEVDRNLKPLTIQNDEEIKWRNAVRLEKLLRPF